MSHRSVVAALEAQNGRLFPSRARDANLAALAAGAPAVVTGQQVGVFLGPLYSLYKAATAVHLARAAGAVPVFWLQTEDHDLAEIAKVAVLGRAGTPVDVGVSVDAEQRVAVAHHRLPDEIEAALAALAVELEGLPHAEAHLALLRRHYRCGARWVDAFAGAFAELFAPEGLVFVDPRDPALAAAAAPVHRQALLEAN